MAQVLTELGHDRVTIAQKVKSSFDLTDKEVKELLNKQ